MIATLVSIAWPAFVIIMVSDMADHWAVLTYLVAGLGPLFLAAYYTSTH